MERSAARSEDEPARKDLEAIAESIEKWVAEPCRVARTRRVLSSSRDGCVLRKHFVPSCARKNLFPVDADAMGCLDSHTDVATRDAENDYSDI